MPDATTPAPAALAVRGIVKTYPGTVALDGVSLQVAPGEIHALLGGNGSGKSTLIKILAGLVRADAGRVEIGGEVLDAAEVTPAAARHAGLRFVHQDPGVFGELSVAENLSIGRGFETSLGGRIVWRDVHRRTAEVLARFAVPARPDDRMDSLGPAVRTMVAIARALQDQEGAGAGAVLVLDEPTASLPDPEVAQLHAALRRYAAAGQTILYVSHRLDEVLAVADRVSVLRDGRLVASEPTSGLTQDALVELILGRTIEPPSDAARVIDGDAVGLEVRGLVTGPLTGVDLVVRRGEIVGLAGLLGSGRTELLRAVFGAEPIDAGAVLVDGEPLDGGGPAAAMAKGVAYVPEDRAADATFAELGVRENLSAADLRRFWRRGRLRHAEEEAEAIDSIGRYLIRTPNGRPLMSTLSGGNQQKVVLARWLRRKPRVLLLDEPSQGVDAGARAEIHHLVKQAADEGAAVVVVSSDLEELISLCDRIAVLRGGRIVAEVPAAGTDAATLTRLAYAPTEVPA